ncbi:MAG: glycosyltransferase family A protein [Erysipelotrichaceae bacterium]
MKEEISVVVTLQHASVECERLLESLKKQVFIDVCFYLCCDSDPALLDFVETSVMEDERFILIKGNQNVASARNQAIKCCKGNYLSFLDEVDWVHSEWLSILYALLTTKRLDIAMSYRACFDEARQVMEHMHPHANIQTFTPLQASTALYSNWELHMSRLRGKLFSCRVLEGFTFDETTLHVDEALLYRLLYASNGVVCTTQPLLYGARSKEEYTASFESDMNLLEIYKQRAAFYQLQGEVELLLKTNKAMFPIHKRLMQRFDGLRAEEKLLYLEENQLYLRTLKSCRHDLWFSHMSKKEMYQFLRSHQSISLWGN